MPGKEANWPAPDDISLSYLILSIVVPTNCDLTFSFSASLWNYLEETDALRSYQTTTTTPTPNTNPNTIPSLIKPISN